MVESQTDTVSSTLVAVDPVSRRISGLLDQLNMLFAQSRKNDWIARQLGIILDAIKEEIEEEKDLFSGPVAQQWIIEFSHLMEWTATGDYSKLSDALIPIAAQIDGLNVTEGAREIVPDV